MRMSFFWMRPSIQNHAATNAVFDSATRVEELALSEDFALDAVFGSDVVDADHRRVSDAVDDAILDFLVEIALLAGVGASIIVGGVVALPLANNVQAVTDHLVVMSWIVLSSVYHGKNDTDN